MVIEMKRLIKETIEERKKDSETYEVVQCQCGAILKSKKDGAGFLYRKDNSEDFEIFKFFYIGKAIHCPKCGAYWIG